MGLEVELLNTIQGDAHDQQVIGDRFIIGKLLWPGPLQMKGFTRRRPGPDHATGGRQALPMIEQRLRFLLSTDQNRSAT